MEDGSAVGLVDIVYVTPVEFETTHSRQANPQEQPLTGKPSLH
jgi:hypothetical protein